MPNRLPHSQLIRVRGRQFGAEEVVNVLSPFVSDERKQRIERVIAHRTYTVTPVVDGVFDMGNVSAVMRTAEALGYQSVHIIESAERFKSSTRTTQGSDKWLDVFRWKTPAKCAEYLRERGYRLVVTHLDAQTRLEDLDFTEPTALVFGNEANGVSDEMLSLASERCIIPMTGFVESFNVSVAAAVALYHAYQQRVSALGSQGDLDDASRDRLRAEFYMRSVKESEAIIDRLASEPRRGRG